MTETPTPVVRSGHRPTDPPVVRLMSAKVVGIVPGASLSMALHVMAQTGVRHLPVLDGDECRGVLLETDVIAWFAETGSMIAPAPPVGELCRPNTSTVPLNGSRSDVAQAMITAGADAVLVTDRGRIVGIVTATDLLRSLADEVDEPGDQTGAEVVPND